MKSLSVLILSVWSLYVFADCGEKTPQDCMSEAKSLVQQGRAAQAIPLWEKACGFQVAQGCLKSGIMAEKDGRLSDAERFYKKACEINKDESCKNALAIRKKQK